MPVQYIISCEHGGNQIPDTYLPLFRDHEALLNSHRGFDLGALQLAKAIAEHLDASLFTATTSRLLVDLNRSVSHPHLFSEVTRCLPLNAKQEILTRYYHPYRSQVEASILKAIQLGKRVIHISAHSFTPILKGKLRTADIGLLYDSTKYAERTLCFYWKKYLKENAANLRIRRNYPYSGKSDGFTTYLRRRFPMDKYAGIELEINQQYFVNEKAKWPTLCSIILKTLSEPIKHERIFITPVAVADSHCFLSFD